MEEKEKFRILGFGIWRIFAYFIIYSFLGYVIETLFAIINYGVLESRQSFLYGPFCGIYGVGAVVMILFLQYFKKSTHTLLLGGFIVGSIVEYIMSWTGEILLHVKWWDYSNMPLNINGRICFLYSLFWSILGLYLIKSINPKIDRFINLLKAKLNKKVIKIIISFGIVFLILDCIISGYAVANFMVRAIVEKDIKVSNYEDIKKIYDSVYLNEQKRDLILKYFGDEKMLKTYPNLTINTEEGKKVWLKDYYKDIQSYYYKFPKGKELGNDKNE